VTNSTNPDLDPLTRTQVLMIMAVTAIILLVIAKVWQYFGSIAIPAIRLTGNDLGFGLAMAGVISTMSGILYRAWPTYRQSADTYLKLVIEPLVWPDLIWIGLLPGLSEELLFRGVILPAVGLNIPGLIVSSCVFGILHFSGSQQWPYVLWATIVGFAFGYTVLLTGNLLIPIIAHIVTNLIASCLWKAQHSIDPPLS
jgi:membrane protease YdiL (CAAX protease family)